MVVSMGTCALFFMNNYVTNSDVCSFSTRVMWLRVANTNNDPKVVAKHFVDCIQVFDGRPVASS